MDLQPKADFAGGSYSQKHISPSGGSSFSLLLYTDQLIAQMGSRDLAYSKQSHANEERTIGIQLIAMNLFCIRSRHVICTKVLEVREPFSA